MNDINDANFMLTRYPEGDIDIRISGTPDDVVALLSAHMAESVRAAVHALAVGLN